MSRPIRRAVLAVMLSCAANAPVFAAVSVLTSTTALPSDPGFVAVPLPDADRGNTGFTIGGAQFSFTNVPKNQGVVHGSLFTAYAAPVIDAAGDLFGGNYLSTALGVITITFAQDQHALALLWGSVDAGNKLSLYEGKTLVGNVLGSDILSNATGNQGFGGSIYTLINSSAAFDTIAMTSSVYSFESALYEVSPSPVGVPEPASVLLLGAALCAMAALRRSR